MLIRMTSIEKFDNLESAFVDVKMNVSLLEIGGMRFPDLGLRISLLNRNPGFIPKAASNLSRSNEEEIKRVMVRAVIDGDDGATHGLTITEDPQNHRI